MNSEIPRGLSASRWARSSIPPLKSWPRPPPPSTITPIPPRPSSDPPNSPHNGGPSPEQELSRFLKIVARLNWKLPFLNQGYNTAIERAGKTQQEAEAHEIHFKLDFHEYYMLIERALVHLMGIYGIAVYGMGSSSMGNGNANASASASTDNLKTGAPRERISQHRYHANVLAALEDTSNPLHEIFGAADVRRDLARAKDLRNRWKYADDPGGEGAAGELHKKKYMPAPLEAYNLEQILKTIFAAFDRAFAVAEPFVRQNAKRRGGDGGGGVDEGGPVSPADWTTEEGDWEFMVDAMDWEAV
ncbi:hypothetical protein F4810DRAFT_683468 [Camillea tinctor]|nr:hypothetical protein F4810DRAFT_683468 [Camillea tinctor]